jgi:hypothetical protein
MLLHSAWADVAQHADLLIGLTFGEPEQNV